MKLFIRIIFVTPYQPQQTNYCLLNLFLLPVNSDKSDEKISQMKIIRYAVLLKGAKFSIFPILVINFGNFHSNIFYYKKLKTLCEVCQT